jgi:hypothetical protein
MVVPFLASGMAQKSPRFDRFLSNLAYPLYLFHWIPRDWYYHFSQRSDPVWKQCLFLAMNFFAAAHAPFFHSFFLRSVSFALWAATLSPT